MNTERMIAIALPHSVSADPHDRFHVSVFLTPKLLADEDATLDSFGIVAHWGRRVEAHTVHIDLRSQEGVIEADAAQLAEAKGDLWKALFPLRTPVAGAARGPGQPAAASRVPDWSKRSWASYPVAETAAFAKSVLISTILADPVTPVPPSGHPLTRGMIEQFRQARAVAWRSAPNSDVPDQPTAPARIWRPSYPALAQGTDVGMVGRPRGATTEEKAWNAWHEAQRDWPGFGRDHVQDVMIREHLLTAQLDDARVAGRPRSRLAVVAPNASAAAALDAAVTDLHEARRFYEPPDPDPKADRTQPTQHAPSSVRPRAAEFHERVASAGDHPRLLRQLGLVIDLVVRDTAALRRARWLSVDLRVEGASADFARSPRVAVQALADDSFVLVPGERQAAQWQDGLLALGEPSEFSVIDVDPDGSALKAGNFLWSLPRQQKVEANGDEVNAAAPALRGGLAVTRTSQLEAAQSQVARQGNFQQAYAEATGPVIPSTAKSLPDVFLADVTRGILIEVYDSFTGSWHSLHKRLSTVILNPRGENRGPAVGAYADFEENGFIQGTAAQQTPGSEDVKIHESVFGWDGWSLSAPRPGNRIRPEIEHNRDGTWTIHEHVEPNPDPNALPAGMHLTHPLVFDTRVAPGTLPRLRYGRAYAFRAWTVDLAGNVRTHDLRPARNVRVAAAGTVTPLLPETPTAGADAGRAAALQTVADRATPLTPPAVTDEILADLERRSGIKLPADLRAALRAPMPPTSVDLAQVLRQATGNLPVTRAARKLSSDEVAAVRALIGSHLGTGAANTRQSTADAAAWALRTTSPLRRYLRWDPVAPPAIVATAKYEAGESLRVIVVRSEVTQLAPGSVPVVATEPKAVSARHLAPPKTTQHDAELHGMFDRSIDGSPGKTPPDDVHAIRAEQLRWALREPGTFFDRRRAPLPTDGEEWPKQDGVSLVGQPTPTASPATNTADPVVPPGDAPLPGSYVIHATPELELPYLPDPAATGVSLRFLDANPTVHANPPRTIQLTTTDFAGTWPDMKPYRLLVAPGASLDAHVEGRDITVTVPAGTTQRFTLASSINDVTLKRSAVWNELDAPFTADPVVVQGAKDGLLWALTPGELVTLVHAVPRPVEAPAFVTHAPWRAAGEVEAALMSLVTVHGPSTSQLALHMRWTETTDAGDRGAVHTVRTDVGFTTRVDSHENTLGLFPVDLDVLPGVRLHKATHHFADTRYRHVTYALRASTRFREYFPAPAAAAPGPDQWLVDDGASVLSETIEVDIPSSAPPPPPSLQGILPLFRWEDAVEPDQPFARRRVRRSGVRIYLDRGWFASGEGEQLGVLLGIHDTPGANQVDDSPYVSQWGRDPVWDAARLTDRRVATMQLRTLVQNLEPEPLPEAARPSKVAGAVPVRVDKDGNTAVVAVAGYDPRYSTSRGLWYVDIAFEASGTFWPFVRLALARYQAHSLANCELSTPVRADFVQIPPERTLTVGRPSASRVSVQLRGQAGHRRLDIADDDPTARDAAVQFSHRVRVRLQKRNEQIGGDLGWDTVSITELPIAGHGAYVTEPVWFGQIDLPVELTLRRPLAQPLDATLQPVAEPDAVPPDNPIPVADTGIPAEPLSDWRVRVEEWERVPGDPPAGDPDRPLRASRDIIESRIVYADDMYL